MEEKYVKENIIINDKKISFFIDYDNKDIYMSQEELTKLFNISIHTIKRLVNNPTGAKFTLVQNSWRYFEIENNEGSRLIKRNIKHYNLTVIKEIGYKLNPNLLNELLGKLSLIFSNDSNNDIIDNSLNKAINYEIVKYYDGNFSLDVSVSPSEETVWLNQNEIAYLFSTNKQSISYHINNIFKDKELEMNQVVKEILTTGNDGKLYNVLYYNLDMIISIGYRVNSKRGIAFRKWATNILKNYLLKGYAINEKRCLECNSSIVALENKIRELENRINILDESLFIDKDIIFDKGDFIGPYKFIKKIFYLAKTKLIILDPYADDFLLSMLENINIDINIYKMNKNNFNIPIKKNITVNIINNFHSRAIFMDNYAFLLSHSFNALGNADIVISKLLNTTIDELLNANK